MSIWAFDLLKYAVEQGYVVTVDVEDDMPQYTNAHAAWAMVKEIGEANVYFTKDGEHDSREWAYLMVPGKMTCDDNETVVDHSCDGFIEKWWDEKFAAEE